MGPDSQGRRWSRRLCLITPILLICCVLFPWSISGHKRGTEVLYAGTSENNSNSSEIRKAVESVNIENLNNNGTTNSSDSDYVTGEFLREALINHSLVHGGEGDLDQLIWSALPHGSKLVLQSVKVIETDEHGNSLPKHNMGNTPVHWDVKITNATIEPDPDTEEEDNDDEDEIVGSEAVEEQNRGVVEVPNRKSAQDLASSGSHAQVNYKEYGTQERKKEKVHKQHHGDDHGKTKKITYTDTDGKTVTNYHGEEDGVKDYKKNHGKSQSNEGERFKDTKKKNKGRRVSGFKRVYHKEEFQRTEHFYDDEDAKRIAESYGMKDKKEDAKHGLKDDDRKYHGTKTEYTDGKEIKDEKSTSHGFNKGQHTAYKDSEKHRQNSNYAKSNAHGSSANYNQNNYHDARPHQEQQYHHPSHNYHGSNSHPKTTLRQPSQNYNSYYMNFKPGYPQSHFSPSSNPLDNADTVAIMAKVPLTASFVLTERPQTKSKQDLSLASSTDDPSILLEDRRYTKKAMKHRLDKSDEKKIYFSPRDRNVKDSKKLDLGHPSKHHFISSQYHQPPSWNNFPRTTFRSKIGSDGTNDSSTRNESSERYGRKYPSATVGNTILDPNYGGYSTITKYNPVNYISLGDEEGLAGSSHVNESDPRENFSQEEGAVVVSDSYSTPDHQEHGGHHGISITTDSPLSYRRPRPPHRPPHSGRWISLSLGDPELVNEIQSNPFNHHHPQPQRRPQYHPHISHLIRGVKYKLRRPGGYSSRFPPPSMVPHAIDISGSRSQYDSSKYPPNVIVNRLKGEGGIKVDKNGVKIPHSSNHSSDFPLGEMMNSQEEDDHTNLVSDRDKGSNGNGILLKPTHSFHKGKITPFNRIPNHRPRVPHSIPPFMNHLMDSVANFFSNVG